MVISANQYMEVSWVMGVPPVIIHFRLGFSLINHLFSGTPMTSQLTYGGFHSHWVMEVHQNRWFTIGHPNLKWMMTGGSFLFRKLPYFHSPWFSATWEWSSTRWPFFWGMLKKFVETIGIGDQINSDSLMVSWTPRHYPHSKALGTIL